MVVVRRMCALDKVHDYLYGFIYIHTTADETLELMHTHATQRTVVNRNFASVRARWTVDRVLSSFEWLQSSSPPSFRWPMFGLHFCFFLSLL